MQEGRISHNYLPYTSLFQVSLCVNSFWEFRHPSETQSCFLWAATHHLKSRSLKNVKTSCNELNYKSAAQSLTQELGLYRSSNPGQSLQNHWIVLHFFPVCYFSGTPFINGLLTCTILKFTLKRMVDYLFEVFLTLSGWNDFLCFPSCFWGCKAQILAFTLIVRGWNTATCQSEFIGFCIIPRSVFSTQGSFCRFVVLVMVEVIP